MPARLRIYSKQTTFYILKSHNRKVVALFFVLCKRLWKFENMGLKYQKSKFHTPVFQKSHFRFSKEPLLHSKRASFALQKSLFWKVKVPPSQLFEPQTFTKGSKTPSKVWFFRIKNQSNLSFFQAKNISSFHGFFVNLHVNFLQE